MTTGIFARLAGVTIVFTILFSALVAGCESIDPFFHPQDISHLWAVAVASMIGFLGNEAVAIFRIRIGRRIGSAALICRWSPCADRRLDQSGGAPRCVWCMVWLPTPHKVFGTHSRSSRAFSEDLSDNALRSGASLRRARNRQYRQTADTLRSMNQHALDVGGRGRPRN